MIVAFIDQVDATDSAEIPARAVRNKTEKTKPKIRMETSLLRFEVQRYGAPVRQSQAKWHKHRWIGGAGGQGMGDHPAIRCGCGLAAVCKIKPDRRSAVIRPA
jgi:hypothetical protein